MSYTFRRMEPEDIEAVHKIENSLFPDPWKPESFRRDVENKTIAYPFVLVQNHEIVAYTVCWYFSGELHIGNVAVAKPFQGQGLGKLMMEHIFNTFPDYIMAYLEVRENNIPAIQLYVKFGFIQLYKRKNYYPGGISASVMVKYRITREKEQ